MSSRCPLELADTILWRSLGSDAGAGLLVVDFPSSAVAVNPVQCFFITLENNTKLRNHMGALRRLTHTDNYFTPP